MLRARRTLEVAAAGAATLLFLAGLLISGSRGAALGLIAGGFAFLLTAAMRRSWPDRRQVLAMATLIVALLPLLWFLRVPMLGRMAGVPGTPPIPPGSPAEGASARSNAFRLLTWQATLKIIQNKPVLGTGAGTFEFALPRYAIAGYTGMAHQSYLQIAAEAGLPALLAWLGALTMTLGRLLSRRRGANDWLLPGLAGGIVAAMAHNIVDYSWYVSGTALPFWLFLGAAVALTRTEPPNHPGAGEPRFGARDERQRRGPGPGEVPQNKGREGHDGDRTRPAQRSTPGARRPTPNAQRPAPGAKRIALGTAGVLLLALNGVWLMAALHRQTAQVAIMNRDARSALDGLGAAAALTPLDAEVQIELGGIRASTGDREAAAAAFRRAANLAPTWGRPHYRLGRLWENAGQLDQAAAAFKQAAARDPRATQPLAALAEVLKAQNDHGAAMDVYRRIVAIEESPAGQIRPLDQMTDTNPAIAREALAREAESQSDRETAIRHYRAAADRLRRWRLDLDFQVQVKQATGGTLTDRELDLLQTEARLWRRLATLYSQTGQTEAAAEALREASAAAAKADQVSAAKL
jgi:tetratricopeptide (TPR) repeat protein